MFDRQSDKPPYWSIWTLRLTKGQPQSEPTPFSVLENAVAERQGQFSPDGRWVAFDSLQSGKVQVYIAPYRAQGARTGEALQISSTEAFLPRWRKDGKQLFYYSSERRRLMAVSISVEHGMLKVGDERELIASDYATIVGFDVSQDGQRFVVRMRSRQAASQPITVVQNWTDALRAR